MVEECLFCGMEIRAPVLIHKHHYFGKELCKERFGARWEEVAEDPENKIPLCEFCHTKMHSRPHILYSDARRHLYGILCWMRGVIPVSFRYDWELKAVDPVLYETMRMIDLYIGQIPVKDFDLKRVLKMMEAQHKYLPPAFERNVVLEEEGVEVD